MEEKYVRCDRIEVAKQFSEICRNSGKTMFPVSYTVTEGNLQIDREFQEFCFKHSNNEYLAGIAILLKIAKHYEDIKSLEATLSEIDSRLRLIEQKISGKEPEEKKEINTF